MSLWTSYTIQKTRIRRSEQAAVHPEQSEKTTIQIKTMILIDGDLTCGCRMRVRVQSYPKEPDTEDKKKYRFKTLENPWLTTSKKQLPISHNLHISNNFLSLVFFI